MSKLLFYYDNLSQPCRALEIFLKINSIPYVPKRVNLAGGEHFQQDYLKINPFKKVPVIDDNGFILIESVAIFRYLCRERTVPDHWYPKNSQLRARVDEYLEWQHTETRAHCALYFRVTTLDPLITGIQPSPKKVNDFKRRMIEVCDKMNDIWLKDGKKYITGDNITIADLLATAELEQLRMTDYDPREGRSALASWMARVRQRTNPYYDEANVRINKLAEKIKSKNDSLNVLSKL
uniref:Putative glutathione s-transferase theta-1 n=1 Tax=Panstrongylus megistus TaxID=65343 RepID=A0A069DR68_9HEMI